MKAVSEKRWSEMTPRERDALVAEHVMKWERREQRSIYDGELLGHLWWDGKDMRGETGPDYAWSPSTRIEDAWEVVEKMGGCWRLKNTADVFDFRWWNGDEDGWERQGFDAWAQADTVPHVICLAALKACGVEVEDE